MMMMRLSPVSRIISHRFFFGGNRGPLDLQLNQNTAIRSFAAFSTNIDQPSPPVTVAILRETYDVWERRAPLSPAHVEQLLGQYNDTDSVALRVLVQPSGQRIFSNDEYQHAGAVLQDDLSDADVILGVKRPVDSARLTPETTHLFFSHTTKGQPENMPLLQDVLERKIQLMDYEQLTTPTPSNTGFTTGDSGKRLVAFGRFAGLAGAIDSFHALGRRLLYDYQVATPFLSCPPTILQENLSQAKDRVSYMGQRIACGLDLGGFDEPLVFGITGQGGRVHEGVMEILNLLPHERVSVDELPNVVAQQASTQYKIYTCEVATEDIMERRNTTDGSFFDRDDYRQNPTLYRSRFAEKVAPYITVLYNCVYWDARFPRLLTKQQMKRLYQQPGKDRLLLVVDVSCDVHGSVEFLERTTSIEKPFFQYDPLVGREVEDSIGKQGITVMGVDILPTELPRESSEHFGDKLVDVVKDLVDAKQQGHGKGIDTTLLAPHLANACITNVDGTLTRGFRYLEPLMKRVPRRPFKAETAMVLLLEGHLFDSGLINQILDVVENNKCGVDFQQCQFPPHSADDRQTSSVLLSITGTNDSVLERVESKIAALVDLIEKAEATMARVDRCRADGSGRSGSSAVVEDPNLEKRVLLLGAGMVSKSVVDLLGRKDDTIITVAGDKNKEAREVAAVAKKGEHVAIDVVNDQRRLSELIEDSDLVISLLPAPMHPQVASECIVHKKHLVTASYESEEMRAMRQRVRDAGIIILNEVGLDPGLDHMSAMKIIDDIKSRGGSVTGFSSVCGGLPAPEAADNPLKYKFSWNPRGVIRASQNDARYRWEGRLMEVHGDELLQNAAPFVAAWPDLHLECLPNRDSLHYEQIYSIQGADTIFRGTLRYRGFSSLMNIFKNMGLFDELALDVLDGESWADVVNLLRLRRGGFNDLEDFVQACADENDEEAQRALDTLRWLGILNGTGAPNPKAGDVVGAFCDVLEEKLRYKEGERDMVAMHHTIHATFEDGTEERHYSSLMTFGDDKMSAMSKTVGYTAAAGAELILRGSLAGERGLLLPTARKVYEPILAIVDLEGISFDESVDIHSVPLHQDG